MKTILFINACVRGKNSRTLKIANTYINKLKKSDDFNIIQRDLTAENIQYITPDSFNPQTGEMLAFSTSLAEEFAMADEIILVAPFWEFLFPAVVNCYFERVSVVGVTFKYSPKGSIGLCKANSFKYIYTSGDYLKEDDKICEKYFQRLCSLYGIKSFSSILLDGLDIQTNNAEIMVNEMCEEIKKGKYE